MPLTPKQERFVAEFTIDGNATQAAIRSGYSAKTAEQQGCRLLRNVQVAAAIAERQQAHLEAIDLTAERVLKELARLAFVDGRRLYNADGTVKPIQDLDADTAAALASFDVVKQNVTAGDGKMDTVIRPRFWDKARALETLAKHFKLLTDIVKIDADGTLIEKLLAGRQRAAQAKSSENSGENS